MVSRLNPVRIGISVPRKTYRLGDTVSVKVDMIADTDVTVREARIGLECQIRYTEMRSGISRRDAANRGIAGAIIPGTAPQTITASVEVELSDTHDGPAFLTNRRLQAGRVNSSSVRLDIPSKLGRNAAYAQSMAWPTFSWLIVVTMDVSLARNVTESASIDVAMGEWETDGLKIRSI